MAGWKNYLQSRWIPLFPLPQFVLFPGVGVPLHVFEGRYRRMMDDLISEPETDRWLALVLLRDNHEHLYDTPEAPIHPVACLSRLLKYERLSDGRYHIIVLGAARVCVLEEDHELPYRRIRAAPLAPPARQDAPTDASLKRLDGLLEKAVRAELIDAGIAEQLQELRTDPQQWVDTLAFHLMPAEESPLKQRILDEPDPEVRADILARWTESRLRRLESRPLITEWPPRPSMN